MSAVFPKKSTSFVSHRKDKNYANSCKKQGIGLIDPTTGIRQWDVSEPE
jgi:hypothetical protein